MKFEYKTIKAKQVDNIYKKYFDAMPCYLTVQDKSLRIINANEKFQKSGEYLLIRIQSAQTGILILIALMIY